MNRSRFECDVCHGIFAVQLTDVYTHDRKISPHAVERTSMVDCPMCGCVKVFGVRKFLVDGRKSEVGSDKKRML